MNIDLSNVKGITLEEIKYMLPKGFQTLGYDILLDTDNFDKPKVIGTFDLCVNTVLMLLFMKPGQFPSIPELGIDIEQYLHEYADDKEIPKKILDQLNEQCNRLQVAGVELDVMVTTLEDKTTNALIVYVKGTPTLAYGQPDQIAIIGITVDKLNRLYAKRRVIQV